MTSTLKPIRKPRRKNKQKNTAGRQSLLFPVDDSPAAHRNSAATGDGADSSSSNESTAADPWLARCLAGVEIEPRPYQTRIITKAAALLDGAFRNRQRRLAPPAHSVLIESPTGSGKTVMGLALARYLEQAHGYSVGWVAMRRNLLSQTERENRAKGFHVELKLISMFDKNPPAVDVLIVDEAQHDAAMSMANLHCAVKPKKIVGLTATPFRTDRIKLCFDHVIADAGIHQLIQGGYLSPYHHFTLPEYTPRSVAECYLADRRRWGKSLVFFHRREQCEEACELLSAGGARAEVVTAQTDRERQLADFEAGRLDVLINMLILTEGFDCPSLQTVFCRPSGRACTIQMGGRVFRKHADLPFKQIVQCRRTPHPFIKTALPAEQYVWSDGQWRSLKMNGQIEAISGVSRRAIAAAPAPLPKLVAMHRPAPSFWRGRRGLALGGS